MGKLETIQHSPTHSAAEGVRNRREAGAEHIGMREAPCSAPRICEGTEQIRKLYIEQNIFSWITQFAVKNELDEDVYKVHGDMIVIGGKKLHIEDMSGKEVAMVQQKLLSWMPKFFVFRDGEQVAEIRKKMALFRAKYVVEGPGWDVRGSILDHDYTILEKGREVVRLHKVWLSWGDCFELDISDGVDEIMALAVVLAIECVMQAQDEAADETHIDD